MNVAISQKYCSHFVILEGSLCKCTFFSIVLRLSSYEMLYSDLSISLFVSCMNFQVMEWSCYALP